MSENGGRKVGPSAVFVLGVVAAIFAIALYRNVLMENRLNDRAVTAELVARIQAARDDEEKSALIRDLLRYEGNGDRVVATAVLTGKMYLARATEDREVKAALLREVIAGFNREADLDGERGYAAAWSLNALARLVDGRAEKRSLYQQAVSSLRGAANSRTRYETSESLYMLGHYATDHAGRHAAFDALLAEYGGDSADAIRAVVARTMLRKANAVDNWREKLAIFDEIIARYSDAGTTKVQEKVVEARQARARLLSDPERRDALRELVLAYHDSPSAAIRKRVKASAESLVPALLEVGDKEGVDAIVGILRGGRSRNAVPAVLLAVARDPRISRREKDSVHRRILEEFGENGDTEIIQAVAMATANVIAASEESEEKVALLNRVFAMHRENPDLALKVEADTVFAVVDAVEHDEAKLSLLDDAAAMFGRWEDFSASYNLFKILERRATHRGTAVGDEIHRHFALFSPDDRPKLLEKQAVVELWACSVPVAREDRVRLFDAFIAKWSGTDDHEIEKSVGNAFMYRASQLPGVGEKMAAYEEIAEKCRGHAVWGDLVIQALHKQAALQRDDDSRLAGYARVVDEWQKDPAPGELYIVVDSVRQVASLSKDAEPLFAFFERLAADPGFACKSLEMRVLAQDLVLPDARKYVDLLLETNRNGNFSRTPMVWAYLLRSRLEPSRAERRGILGSVLERAQASGQHNREFEQAYALFFRLGANNEEKQAALDAYVAWAEDSRNTERIAKAVLFKAEHTESAAEKLALYDGIIDRYGKTGNYHEARAVTEAMAGKAAMLEPGERDGMYRQALQVLVDAVNSHLVEESGYPVHWVLDPILQGMKRSFGDGAVGALLEEGSWSDRFTSATAKGQFWSEVVLALDDGPDKAAAAETLCRRFPDPNQAATWLELAAENAGEEEKDRLYSAAIDAARRYAEKETGLIGVIDLVRLLPQKAARSPSPEERAALYGEVIELSDQWYSRSHREHYQALVGKAMATDHATERLALLNRAFTEKPQYMSWDYPALRAQAGLGLAREESEAGKREALYRQVLDGLLREGDLLMDITRDIATRSLRMTDRAAQPDWREVTADPGPRDGAFFAAIAGAADDAEKAVIVAGFLKALGTDAEPPLSLRVTDAILDFAAKADEGGVEFLDRVLAVLGGTTDTLFAMRVDDLRARRVAMETDAETRLALLRNRIESLAAVEETDRLIHLLIRRADAMEERDRAAVCRRLALPDDWVGTSWPLAIADNRELLRAMLRWADAAESEDAAMDMWEAIEDIYGKTTDPWNAAAIASLRHESPVSL